MENLTVAKQKQKKKNFWDSCTDKFKENNETGAVGRKIAEIKFKCVLQLLFSGATNEAAESLLFIWGENNNAIF